jgi:hypothetical protein
VPTTPAEFLQGRLINQGAYASSGGKDKKKKKLDLDEPVGM